MKKRVAILTGGKSPEREICLGSGNQIKHSLDENKYDGYLLDVQKNSALTELINSPPDIAFLALHGQYGEDGTIQGFLEYLNIPYTGSDVLASSIAISKTFTKRIYAESKILTAPSFTYQRANFIYENAKKDIDTLGCPVIIKPDKLGSTIGTTKVNNPDELKTAFEKAFNLDKLVMAEQFINGIELTVGVIGNNKELQALPVIEIVPKKGFFDYEAKYTPGATDEIVPARISKKQTMLAQEIGIQSHRALGCYGISRTDIILTSDDKMYVLETNTCPGFTENSLIPKASRCAGINMTELISKLLTWAEER